MAVCKVCGTEIADKALICYKCGTSTFEPTRRERQPRRRTTNLLPSLVALLVLIIAALLTARATVSMLPRLVTFVVALVAAIYFALQIVRRRR